MRAKILISASYYLLTFLPFDLKQVKIGEEVRKTRVIHGTASPYWLQHMGFIRISSDVMNVDIWDENEEENGDDIDLGTCAIPLEKVPGRRSEHVRCNATSSGFVQLVYTCI